MKPLPRLLCGCLLLLAALPAAAFEGRVHFDIKSGRDTQQIVYSIKGEKARFEMPGTEMSGVILDVPKQEMQVLMPEQKMYMAISLAQTARMASRAGADEIEFEDTGETETILGRKCRKYRTTDRNGTTDIWGAAGMGTFMAQLGGSPMRGGNKGVPAWQRALGEKGFFPLRVIGSNRRGKETLRMEATKIDETSLDDELFEIPAGYQKFDMGGLMRGMIPGMK